MGSLREGCGPREGQSPSLWAAEATAVLNQSLLFPLSVLAVGGLFQRDYGSKMLGERVMGI